MTDLALVPSLNPFLAFLAICFKCRILPVPVVLLLIAFLAQLSAEILTRLNLTSSELGAGVA